MSADTSRSNSVSQAGPSNIDIYRPLAAAVKKPILPFTSSTIPDLPTLLGIPPSAYSRIENKNVLLNSEPKGPSELVKGRKRNRGDDKSREIAKKEAEAKKGKGLRRIRKLHEGGSGIARGSTLSYQALIPLHYLHTKYLFELLNLPPLPPALDPLSSIQIPSSEGIQTKLLRADFTGVILSTVSSRNPSLAEKTGIVIEETASTFRIVQKDDQVKIIPKDGTLFRLSFPAYSLPLQSVKPSPLLSGEIDEEDDESQDLARHIASTPQIQIDLLGTAFGFRSGDRAGRKFRPVQGGNGGSGWGESWVKGEWAFLNEDAGKYGLVEGKGDQRKLLRGGLKEKRKGGKGDGKSDEWGHRKANHSRRKDPKAGGTIESVS